MTKVLVVNEHSHGACDLYRSFGVLQYIPNLEISYIQQVMQDISKGTDLSRWNNDYKGFVKHCAKEILGRGFGVIWCQRLDSKAEYIDLVIELKQQGVRIIYDLDDDIWNVPMGNPAYSSYCRHANIVAWNGKKRINVAEYLIKLADVVTVATKTIAKVIKAQTGVDSIVIPNCFDPELAQMQQAYLATYQKTNPIILWRGAGGHSHNYDCYATPLVNAVKKHWAKKRFVSMGWCHWAFEQKGLIDHKHYFYLPRVPLAEYKKQLSQIVPQYSLVMLSAKSSREKAFNKAKSNIAMLETVFMGAACICPAFLPEWDFAGAIHYTDTNSFYKKLESAFTDKNAYIDKNRQTREWVLENRNLKDWNKTRTEIINA